MSLPEGSVKVDLLAKLRPRRTEKTYWRSVTSPVKSDGSRRVSSVQRSRSGPPAEGLGIIREQLAFALEDFADEEVVYLSDGRRDNPFSVYDRTGLPCVVCGTRIQRGTQAGRSTWWCPSCQARDAAPDLR